MTGQYYVQGNSTLIDNNTLVNCQRVEYSADFVYVTATGVPSYPTGPFLDRNPSNATDQNLLVQLPLKPTVNAGVKQSTVGGNIGVFINGVALFDFRDGVGWNSTTNALCGGPGNAACPGGRNAATPWNRDAIPAERPGFDCAKGHPAMGNYHHHQNPSAFKLDLETVSTVCNLYDADGLYAIDSTRHSPLIGFAYDGFPIYGAYGFAKADGTGGITRIKSGYALRDITARTMHANGTTVTTGPPVSTTYPLGYFREDYAYVAAPADPAVLDVHNGRFSVTPEYPNGTYAYFATVDENWNSAYPYVVGPTFNGNYVNRKVTSINEATTVYNKTSSIGTPALQGLNLLILPNPASELIAIQVEGLVERDLELTLLDVSGRAFSRTRILTGGTVAHFDVQTLYAGMYVVQVTDGEGVWSRQVVVE